MVSCSSGKIPYAPPAETSTLASNAFTCAASRELGLCPASVCAVRFVRAFASAEARAHGQRSCSPASTAPAQNPRAIGRSDQSRPAACRSASHPDFSCGGGRRRIQPQRPNRVRSFHRPRLDFGREPLQVRVHGGHPVRSIEVQGIAVAPWRHLDARHLPVGCCNHHQTLAPFRFEVHAGVEVVAPHFAKIATQPWLDAKRIGPRMRCFELHSTCWFLGQSTFRVG